MKSNKLKVVLLAVLFALSLSAFIFINTTNPVEATKTSTEQELMEDKEGAKEIVLPDIEFIKRIIESGKRFFPAS